MSQHPHAPAPADTDLADDEQLALALHEIELKAYASALVRLKRLVAADPPQSEALQSLAKLYGTLGLPQRAQVQFERYLAQRPQALHERFELGMSLLEQGQPEQALQQWQAVLQQQAGYPPALYFSAVALAGQSQQEEACRCLDELFAVSAPDNVYHERGLALAQRLQHTPPPLQTAALLPQATH